MKIETLQSLLLSWLRNIMECQVVQTNWKSSSKWELKHEETLEQIIQNSANVFKIKYGYNLHKGNNSIQQLLDESKIDLIGISFKAKKEHIYAIDADFNDDKLSYGTKDETIFRVIKKCIRIAMCMYGYFGFDNGTIIFTYPKINPSVINDINARVDDIVSVLNDLGLNYIIRIIANEEFTDNIREPVIDALGDTADISELFMGNLQMDNEFVEEYPETMSGIERNTNQSENTLEIHDINYSGMDEFKEMKIGAIVRKVLLKMLEDGNVSKGEIDLMQTKAYSKETFGIQYPLLQKGSITNGVSPMRYYSSTIKIYGERYFLCSEWYEVPANNDRPYLLKWFALHKD